jgi:hypothetical protein
MQKATLWTLNKLIVLLALGAFFMLMMELRFEHMDVLGDHWQAWVPIVFSGVMIVVGIWGLYFWERGGRKVLFWAFAVSIIVGLLGVWFHDKGKPWESVTVVAQAWQTPIVKHRRRQKETNQPAPARPDDAKEGGKKEEKPNPPLAPLSFSGMGLLGMLACWKKEIP